MDKRDEISDPTSCLNRALDDEPVFVLLGRDVAAPAAVVAWIQARILQGKNAPEDEQLCDAWKWIAKVVRWREQKGKL